MPDTLRLSDKAWEQFRDAIEFSTEQEVKDRAEQGKPVRNLTLLRKETRWFLDTVFYILRNGGSWRIATPEGYLKGPKAYVLADRWQARGVWRRVRGYLQDHDCQEAWDFIKDTPLGCVDNDGRTLTISSHKQRQQELLKQSEFMPIEECNRLVEANLKLVGFVVDTKFRWIPKYGDRDEIYAAGLLGLMKASRKFNPGMGSKFSTFAVYAILSELKVWWRKAEAHYKTNRQPLYHVAGPYEAENAEFLGGSSQPQSPVEIASLNERADHIKRVMDENLTHRQVAIVTAIMNGATLDQAGEAYRITRERTRQIAAAAYARLAEPLRAFEPDQPRRRRSVATG